VSARRSHPARPGGRPARIAGEDAVAALEAALAPAGRPARARAEKAYLRSDLEFLGVGVPALRSAVRAFARAHPDLGRQDLVRLVEALWARPVHELRAAGIGLLARFRDRLMAGDMRLLERLLRRSHTWAYVDWLALDVVAPLVARSAAASRRLDRWARDRDFWIRRSALLALLPPLRSGGGDFRRFERFAAPMLADREFFIRKAIGWVLREVGKRRPALVARFAGQHLPALSGLTFREAVKYLPPADRRRLTARRAALR
jgi:3-methyladenine DNA glycosylase AlkD